MKETPCFPIIGAMKALVIGSGGREHAIAWALSNSPEIEEVLCVPGNGGTAVENKCRNLDILLKDLRAAADAAVQELGGTEGVVAVIGPENPLTEGAADILGAKGIPVVGPTKAAAQLEASKDAAKKFMKKYGVACAASETYTDLDSALKAVNASSGPVVVKADGLAAGKGVVVAGDKKTAEEAVRRFMVDGELGEAGKRLVIEEYLEGEEISVLAAVSVTPETSETGQACIIPFVPARDHKRLLDGAEGPNTGGMGAIAPVPGLDGETMNRFRKEILEPTLAGLKAEKFDYRGFIFFGLMLTKNGPKLLEYNVRLGDPETQAVLPLMDFDFAKMCLAITDGTLKSFSFKWKEGFVCAPVAVSGGYPGEYGKHKLISVDGPVVKDAGGKIFIAGAVLEKDGLYTTGGRVLAGAASGETAEKAREAAYKTLSGVSFEGMFFRKDIGAPGAAVSKTMKGGKL